MKRMLKAAAALLLGGSMLVTGAMAAAPNFSDVPSGHWAYTYVSEAYENGLVSGKGGGLYGVNDALNIGEFATMLCGLLYPEADDPYAGKSSYWWYQYAEAAYQKGDLDGTVAGERRTSDGAWTATVVQQPMSRYDLAQIIANVMDSQGWPEPDATLIFLAMATIPDWSDIPSSYQTAVAMAYAGGFLSGKDGGRFDGESGMTRGEAAVVLCAMLEAKNEQDAPTYTNRPGRLVNGDEANEDNVRQALSDLKGEFNNYYFYDVDRTYTSQRLGTASGEKGFAYMLSDRVFGALTVEEQDDPDRLKPGDLVELDGEYQVVTDVSGNSYDYVVCDSMGIVYWRTDGKISDINTRYDTIWTRYEGEEDYELDEDRASDLIDEFLDEEYDINAVCYECEDGYKSPEFYDKKVYEDQAFAYYLSDYIFGEDQPVDEMDGDEVDIYDIRIGDVIYLADDDLYVVVTDVDTKYDEISYLYTNSSDKVKSSYFDFNELDFYDTIYTRYEDIINRSDLDEDDVADLIDEFMSDSKNGYNVGDIYEDDDGYESPEFGNKTYFGDRAFAYYMSDYIFGEDSEVEETSGNSVRYKDVRLGDIIYMNDDGIYYVVIELDDDEDSAYCLYVREKDNKVRTATLYPTADMGSDDVLYTRY